MERALLRTLNERASRDGGPTRPLDPGSKLPHLEFGQLCRPEARTTTLWCWRPRLPSSGLKGRLGVALQRAKSAAGQLGFDLG